MSRKPIRRSIKIDLVNDDIIRSFRCVKFSPFIVPFGVGFESSLFKSFVYVGRPVRLISRYFVGSKRVFSVYYFGRSIVVVRYVGKGVVSICFSNDVDKWLRYDVLYNLYSRLNYTKRFMEVFVVDMVGMRLLSDLLSDYFQLKYDLSFLKFYLNDFRFKSYRVHLLTKVTRKNLHDV